MIAAYIKIWDKLVGAVSWNAGKRVASFEYDPSFLQQGLELAPVMMPMAQARQIFSFAQLDFETFRGLPGLLADALPDDFGNHVIDTWLARQGRSLTDFSPVDRLCYIGKRGMGALEFSPAMKVVSDRSSTIELEGLIGLAQQVLNSKASFHTQIVGQGKQSEQAMQDILKVGTSAGGARPKAVIALNPKTLAIRSGQVKAPQGYEYWLLKFDGIEGGGFSDPAGYGKIEYGYYKMAMAAGINMSRCRLLEENGRAHFMSQRFDRTEDGDKIHLQSLCALAHYDYRKAGAYGYEQAFMVMRQLRLPYADFEQQYRRMVFNVIARNQDDHTKNISFLMDKQGEWRLSPAYDVTYSYNPDGQWTHQHQMSINGKRDHIQRSDLLQVADNVGIKRADHIVDEVSTAVSRWPQYGAEAGVSAVTIQQITKVHRLSL